MPILEKGHNTRTPKKTAMLLLWSSEATWNWCNGNHEYSSILEKWTEEQSLHSALSAASTTVWAIATQRAKIEITQSASFKAAHTLAKHIRAVTEASGGRAWCATSDAFGSFTEPAPLHADSRWLTIRAAVLEIFSWYLQNKNWHETENDKCPDHFEEIL